MGSSSATVIAGPMPGSTPTAVPSSTPITAYSRFIGVAASAKPWSSQLKLSMSENSVQNACGQRDPESGVEGVEADQRQHGADGDVADVVPAAQDRCRTGKQQRAGDRPAERLDEQDHRNEQADEHPDRAPVARAVRVDVLARIRLADRSAGDRDRKDDRQPDENDADGQREEPRPDRVHLGETAMEGERVVDQESADRDEHDADEVLRLVDGCRGLVLLRLFGGGHISPNSVSVDETRLSWSFRNCSNCAPVMNASVQPFFTSASFH